MKSNVKNYTDKELIKKVVSLSSYRQIPTDYWILGVRSQEDAPDEFDDKFYLFRGKKFIAVMSGSTNSGVYGLLNFNKWNSKGCAVMKSDEWYYDLWTPGYHNGKMKALRQMKSCKFYRDNNKDKKIDESGQLYQGIIGLNFHTASYSKDPKFIEKFKARIIGQWSVGCQVANDMKEYMNWIDILWKQDRVTYCLIKEF